VKAIEIARDGQQRLNDEMNNLQVQIFCSQKLVRGKTYKSKAD